MQKPRAEMCRPGILLELRPPFPGRGARCPPEASLCHKHPEGKSWILFWALGLAPGSVKALTLQGIKINCQHMELVWSG